ncbi:MAG TPA: histidine kinase dimerization/phospho-acceptor domain-containing protein, partial [Pyrinomonadaceae bacterium]|nr:histidine kinase dimerization/phospho-acceptor domain-containing protein [Pyrinomonadaceae bacterium]
MATLDHTSEWSRTTGLRLGWLIAGRLATALVLSIFGTIWTRTGESPQTLTKSIGLVTIVACLTILYALIFRLSKNILFQARFQLAIDVLLVTWLVWDSSAIQSPYIALYILIIAISSLFLGPREPIITSVGCAVAFTTCSLQITGLFGQLEPTRLVRGSVSETIQWIGLFDVAFFVVGLLSARLAERQSRSDVRLLAATQSLANLRALHERIIASIRSGLVTTDLEGRIFTFNAAAEEITGYQEEKIRGQDASILFGELKDHIADTLKAMETGERSPRFEANCFTFEGMRLRLGYSISPLSSEAGQITGMVITFQDLTQVRSLEETSRRQDRLAAIGRMAASIAHEIRNPLAAMRGSIQMLRSELDSDSSQAELMEIILRESDRLNRIITDFLNYARPRSLSQARVDVGDLLHQTFALMRHSPEIAPN